MALTEEERQRIYEEEKARQEIRDQLEKERRERKRPRLRKSRNNKVFFGVAGGLAEHFDFDPVLVRLAFAVLCFVNLIGLVAYVVLAILMPQPEDATSI